MTDASQDIVAHLKRYYDVTAPHIRRINHGIINSNFRVTSPEGAYIFKIFNLRNDLNVRFELEILEFLALKNFPSPRVVPAKSGQLFRQFRKKPAALLHYIPGQMITDITAHRMSQIGAGVGTLHRLLENYNQCIERVTWEPEDIKRHIRLESENIIHKNYPDARNFISYVSRELEAIDFPLKLPQGLTHQDIKPENIIVDQAGHISFIDFNDCYIGTMLFDMMTTVIWSCFENDGKLDDEMSRAYLRGYTAHRPLTPIERNFCFEALQFRLLREAFVWPMRFSPELAEAKSQKFLSSYDYLQTNRKKCRSMIADCLAGSGETVVR
jgi:homoserine kinase type II